MADYKEENVTGKKWTRCHAVYIRNAFNEPPSIEFSEQSVVSLGNNEFIKTNANTILAQFDSNSLIELLDTTTLLPTGQTVPEGLVYLALFSKYIKLAKERDNAPVAIPLVSTL